MLSLPLFDGPPVLPGELVGVVDPGPLFAFTGSLVLGEVVGPIVDPVELPPFVLGWVVGPLLIGIDCDGAFVTLASLDLLDSSVLFPVKQFCQTQ